VDSVYGEALSGRDRRYGTLVKTIDSSRGRYPDITLAIFKQGVDGIARQPIGTCETINFTMIDMVDSRVERAYPKSSIPVPQEGRDMNVLSVKAVCTERPNAKRRRLLQSQVLSRPNKPDQHRRVGTCKEGCGPKTLRVTNLLPNETSNSRAPLACTEFASDPEFSGGVLRDEVAEVTRLPFGQSKTFQYRLLELAKST
jgi:hypothetical protein